MRQTDEAMCGCCYYWRRALGRDDRSGQSINLLTNSRKPISARSNQDPRSHCHVFDEPFDAETMSLLKEQRCRKKYLDCGSSRGACRRLKLKVLFLTFNNTLASIALPVER